MRKASKRQSLRLSGHGRTLRYLVDGQSGRVRIIDISSGGYAVKDASVKLTVGKILQISLFLDSPEQPIEIAAIVLSAQAGNVGIKFLEVEKSQQRRILQFLAQDTAA